MLKSVSSKSQTKTGLSKNYMKFRKTIFYKAEARHKVHKEDPLANSPKVIIYFHHVAYCNTFSFQ